MKLSDKSGEIISWKPTTGCIPLKDLPLVSPPEMRAACSNSLLRCSRTLLPRSAILAWWRLARDTYVGKLFSASVTHLPLAGFHLFVMGMIIPHDRASIVNRYMSEILLARLANHTNWACGNRGESKFLTEPHETRYSRN